MSTEQGYMRYSYADKKLCDIKIVYYENFPSNKTMGFQIAIDKCVDPLLRSYMNDEKGGAE